MKLNVVVGEVRGDADELLKAIETDCKSTDILDHREFLLKSINNIGCFSKEEIASIKSCLEKIYEHNRLLC